MSLSKEEDPVVLQIDYGPPVHDKPQFQVESGRATGGDVDLSDRRLEELGYRPQFRRDMSLFGVLGVSFCAIGILTGMSSAFQTGLFAGGPLGLFWGWNVSTGAFLTYVLAYLSYRTLKVCSFFMFLIALSLAEICSA